MKITKQTVINSIVAAAAFFATLLAKDHLVAQEGMIRYRQIWKPATSFGKWRSAGIPSFLFFRNDRSLYVYNRSIENLDPDITGDPVKASPDPGYTDTEDPDDEGNMFYKDFSQGRLMIRQLFFGEAFITEEPLPIIQWKLVSGEKDIGIFRCKKAVTNFRGRNYEAWYTPEIPLKNGPWKFHGLPGLILEAYDTDKEIWFSAEAITIPYNTAAALRKPLKGRSLMYEDFKYAELKKGKSLIDSLRSAPGMHGDNTIRLEYFPVEKSYP